MTSLKANLVKRIERLPKPTNSTTALQPLFEAVSNAIQATQGRFPGSVAKDGKVVVTASIGSAKDGIWVSVEDNGVGLDDKNWDAFTTTDTDNKIRVGGKGVGRLLWLDCFEKITVESVFRDNDDLKRRKFRFVLASENQIQGSTINPAMDADDTVFHVKFEGLRANGYREKFPKKKESIFQHLASHFLPVFIGGRSPSVRVIVGDEVREYPSAIKDIVLRDEPGIALETEKYGTLHLTLMECDKSASSDLKGFHFIHFIAHDRTVLSRSIDAKLGLKLFGEEKNRVFHAILKGDFLDTNVNQERTAFTFGDKIIDDIINGECMAYIEIFLEDPIANLKGAQRKVIDEIAATYPSVAFGDSDALQAKVPLGEMNGDAIYGCLSRERYRRDRRQADSIRSVLSRLKDSPVEFADLEAQIQEASIHLEDAKRRSLSEYVLRRKVILDLIGSLINKIRDNGRDSDYCPESVLHSLICPMQTGNIPNKNTAAASHDLWIVDERLTFTKYFSSDLPLKKFMNGSSSKERPDVLVFDQMYGLCQPDVHSNKLSKVLLVEFKRPGRTDYSNGDDPLRQVENYISNLLGGHMNDVRGREIKSIDQSTTFHCYIVADCTKSMEKFTFSWQKSPCGRRYTYYPRSNWSGFIELVGWDTLLEDAKDRNQAFFEHAGISGQCFFGID